MSGVELNVQLRDARFDAELRYLLTVALHLDAASDSNAPTVLADEKKTDVAQVCLLQT